MLVTAGSSSGLEQPGHRHGATACCKCACYPHLLVANSMQEAEVLQGLDDELALHLAQHSRPAYALCTPFWCCTWRRQGLLVGKQCHVEKAGRRMCNDGGHQRPCSACRRLLSAAHPDTGCQNQLRHLLVVAAWCTYASLCVLWHAPKRARTCKYGLCRPRMSAQTLHLSKMVGSLRGSIKRGIISVMTPPLFALHSQPARHSVCAAHVAGRAGGGAAMGGRYACSLCGALHMGAASLRLRKLPCAGNQPSDASLQGRSCL
jgi:hypothetical protein